MSTNENSDEGNETPSDLEKYIGVYESSPWGGERQIISWKGGLATVSFPTQDPLDALARLKHIEENTFRRIRDDDSLGEEWTFEVDAQGRVLRVWTHSNSSARIP